MKQKQCKKDYRVNQVKIEFTNKPITAWGGMACQIGKFWVLRLGVRGQKLRGKICHLLERIMRIPHRLNCNAVGEAGS